MRPREPGFGLAEADRAHIEAFLADLLVRWKPATAANRNRWLKVFSAWLQDEGEIAADPMAKMKLPRPSPSLDRYLRVRVRCPHPESPWLKLGQKAH